MYIFLVRSLVLGAFFFYRPLLVRPVDFLLPLPPRRRRTRGVSCALRTPLDFSPGVTFFRVLLYLDF